MTAAEARVVERLQLAFELHEAGVAMMRQTLKRRHPEASEQALDAALGRWLRTRPGAPHGDAVGRPRQLP